MAWRKRLTVSSQVSGIFCFKSKRLIFLEIPIFPRFPLLILKRKAFRRYFLTVLCLPKYQKNEGWTLSNSKCRECLGLWWNTSISTWKSKRFHFFRRLAPNSAWSNPNFSFSKKLIRSEWDCRSSKNFMLNKWIFEHKIIYYMRCFSFFGFHWHVVCYLLN